MWVVEGLFSCHLVMAFLLPCFLCFISCMKRPTTPYYNSVCCRLGFLDEIPLLSKKPTSFKKKLLPSQKFGDVACSLHSLSLFFLAPFLQYHTYIKHFEYAMIILNNKSNVLIHSSRSSSRAQVNPEGAGAPHADRIARDVCHPYFCHHRLGILLRSSSQNVLLHRQPR